jgi:hypothetical protein
MSVVPRTGTSRLSTKVLDFLDSSRLDLLTAIGFPPGGSVQYTRICAQNTILVHTVEKTKLILVFRFSLFITKDAHKLHMHISRFIRKLPGQDINCSVFVFDLLFKKQTLKSDNCLHIHCASVTL